MRSRVMTRGLRVLAMIKVRRHRGRRKGNAILPLSGPVDKTQCANMTVEDSGDPIVECLQLDNILVVSVQANNFGKMFAFIDSDQDNISNLCLKPMGIRLVPISFPHFEPQTFLLEVAEEDFVEMGIFAQLEFLQSGGQVWW